MSQTVPRTNATTSARLTEIITTPKNIGTVKAREGPRPRLILSITGSRSRAIPKLNVSAFLKWFMNWLSHDKNKGLLRPYSSRISSIVSWVAPLPAISMDMSPPTRVNNTKVSSSTPNTIVWPNQFCDICSARMRRRAACNSYTSHDAAHTQRDGLRRPLGNLPEL